MKLDLVNGTEYEPDNKNEEANKREHGDDQFEEEGHETAAATARTTARAVVLLCRWDFWTIIGAIQALFICHDRVVGLDQKAKRE